MQENLNDIKNKDNDSKLQTQKIFLQKRKYHATDPANKFCTIATVKQERKNACKQLEDLCVTLYRRMDMAYSCLSKYLIYHSYQSQGRIISQNDMIDMSRELFKIADKRYKKMRTEPAWIHMQYIVDTVWPSSPQYGKFRFYVKFTVDKIKLTDEKENPIAPIQEENDDIKEKPSKNATAPSLNLVYKQANENGISINSPMSSYQVKTNMWLLFSLLKNWNQLDTTVKHFWKVKIQWWWLAKTLKVFMAYMISVLKEERNNL